jgi:hypothetical protein
MIKVVSEVDGYTPFAGSNCCTIRNFAGMVQGLMVGDHVVMHHTHDPKSNDNPIATELLRVSSMAIGPLELLMQKHRERETFADILEFYPVPEGEVRNPDTLFIAIYF